MTTRRRGGSRTGMGPHLALPARPTATEARTTTATTVEAHREA